MLAFRPQLAAAATEDSLPQKLFLAHLQRQYTQRLVSSRWVSHTGAISQLAGCKPGGRKENKRPNSGGGWEIKWAAGTRLHLLSSAGAAREKERQRVATHMQGPKVMGTKNKTRWDGTRLARGLQDLRRVKVPLSPATQSAKPQGVPPQPARPNGCSQPSNCHDRRRLQRRKGDCVRKAEGRGGEASWPSGHTGSAAAITTPNRSTSQQCGQRDWGRRRHTSPPASHLSARLLPPHLEVAGAAGLDLAPPQLDAAIAERSLEAFLSKRQAAMEAPNPESMLTTVTPGAEELRAVSSGATPPKAVP